MENDVYKIRSLGSCMKAAYTLFTTNLKTILRRTWLPAVVMSVLAGLMVLPYFNYIYHQPTPTQPVNAASITLMVSAIVFSLLEMGASAWLTAIIVSLLNGRSMKANLPRIIRYTLVLLLIVCVVAVVSTGVSFIPFATAGKAGITTKVITLSSVLSLAVSLCFVIALLPLYYSSMKYFMEPERKVFSILGKPYRTGWRYWGYLFMLCLLAGIIVTIIYLIVTMPASVLGLATMNDAFGLELGDASGMPGYMRPVACVATAISAFILTYVMVWMTVLSYYAYGHIEAKEKMKQENKAALAKSSKEVETDFEEIK